MPALPINTSLPLLPSMLWMLASVVVLAGGVAKLSRPPVVDCPLWSMAMPPVTAVSALVRLASSVIVQAEGLEPTTLTRSSPTPLRLAIAFLTVSASASKANAPVASVPSFKANTPPSATTFRSYTVLLVTAAPAEIVAAAAAVAATPSATL